MQAAPLHALAGPAESKPIRVAAVAVLVVAVGVLLGTFGGGFSFGYVLGYQRGFGENVDSVNAAYKAGYNDGSRLSPEATHAPD